MSIKEVFNRLGLSQRSTMAEALCQLLDRIEKLEARLDRTHAK